MISMMPIMDSGMANSYCSHRRPPFPLRAMKAGAPTRLMALTWVAMMESPICQDGMARPPR